MYLFLPLSFLWEDLSDPGGRDVSPKLLLLDPQCDLRLYELDPHDQVLLVCERPSDWLLRCVQDKHPGEWTTTPSQVTLNPASVIINPSHDRRVWAEDGAAAVLHWRTLCAAGEHVCPAAAALDGRELTSGHAVLLPARVSAPDGGRLCGSAALSGNAVPSAQYWTHMYPSPQPVFSTIQLILSWNTLRYCVFSLTLCVRRVWQHWWEAHGYGGLSLVLRHSRCFSSRHVLLSVPDLTGSQYGSDRHPAEPGPRRRPQRLLPVRTCDDNGLHLLLSFESGHIIFWGFFFHLGLLVLH